VVPSALKALQTPVSQRSVAALQARIRELTKQLSGEQSRRRAADEARAEAENAAVATRRDMESLRRALDGAAQEIAVKEQECVLLAQLVHELRASKGRSPGRAASD